ncbi:MAG TPA: chromosome segregation protein SMC [Kofleriaceae bacterium]|nr:chromosome segregation protein SMC [Kofleriaceae bacterium]
MRIKKIEIIGFKSFCDRSVLRFDDPVTGIVGPNGCGKSNVVDAIRWCMGEQSAKHLRGKAMDDVIFAGSDSRSPAGMAEVSLTFEDVGFSAEIIGLESEEAAAAPVEAVADGEPVADEAVVDGEASEAVADGEASEAAVAGEAEAVAVDADVAREPTAVEEAAAVLADSPPPIDYTKYAEVTITRRLFKDGSSGYFINKTPCRLRDITDFFLGTGVGTKAYSIIEQGRIGMIVSSRPQDRRLIIEEAAGITKFKVKKRAAERKLEQTRQNLARVADIVAELEKRLGSLKRQAQKAERYRRYKSELRDIDMWIAAHRHLAYAAEEKSLCAERDATADQRDQARESLATKEAEIAAERAELAVEERRLAALQEAIYELENRVKLSEGKADMEAREARALADRATAAEGEIRSQSARREEVSRDLVEARETATTIASELLGARELVTLREGEATAARGALASAQAALDDARGKLASCRSEVASAEAQLESFARRKEDAQRRLARVEQERDDARSRLSATHNEAKGVDGRLAALRQTRMDLGARAESFESRRRELTQATSLREAEVEALRTELHRRRSRHKALLDIHDKYEGFARGTRAVMQRASELAAEAPDGIRGLVADVVCAPERLEAAVEAALGDRLGGILVRSHDLGARAVHYLKDQAAGRSAFVPFVPPASAPSAAGIVVEDRSAAAAGALSQTDPGADLGMESGAGVIGPMLDLVEVDGGMEEVGQALLRDHVVVDTLEHALELHHRGSRKVFVTLDGDVVDPSGVVTGGSRESKGASVLAQKREIRQLEEIIGGLEADLADATARFVSTKADLSSVGKALEAVRTETHDGELEITAHEKDLGRWRGEAERLRERLVALDAEHIELSDRLEGLGREETQVRDTLVAGRDGIAEFERAQLGLIEGVTEGQVQAEALAQALTAAKVQLAQLTEKRQASAQAVTRLEAAEAEVAERLTRLEGSIREDRERAETLKTDALALAEKLVGMRQDLATQADTFATDRGAYEHRTGLLAVAETSLREVRKLAESLTARVSELDVKLAELRINRETLAETMAERYQLDLARNLGDYHMRPQVGDGERERLRELRQLIARMGADINLTAIDELREVEGRHHFLSSQKDDLERAVDKLEHAIHKINTLSRKLFRDMFTAVNNKFQEVFPRLFRGGRARLKLTSDGDADVLDAGVEIMAQPPGKKNTTVEQLSGGEKALTAVALIFSIFLVKPSPFCLLDEVDAPLDDINVDRYNELVREMTHHSQFIVITHNKRTMEIADRLYGVTMQEPGCSKLVAVNLSKLETRQAA